jgi:hypothetical protein
MRIALIAVVACICTAVLAGFRHRPDVDYVFEGTDPGRAPTTRPAASIYLEPLIGEDARWLVDSGGVIRELSEGVRGEPSRHLHHGKRWFLTTRALGGQTYSDGSPRREVFCVNEDGHAVKLTNRPDLEPGPFGIRWLPHGNDLQISWIARQRSSEGKIVQGGVYTARLALDEYGEPAGLTAQAQTPVLAVDLVTDWGLSPWTLLPVPDVCGHDWSPDGRKIVIESVRQELRMADLATGEQRLLVTEPGCDPVWSPDGSVIAFKQMQPFGAIITVCPDGRVRKAILPGFEGDYVVCRPVFAPDGEYLAHTRVHRYRSVARSGPGDNVAAWVTKLTPTGEDRVLDAPRGYVPVAWREGPEEGSGRGDQP